MQSSCILFHCCLNLVAGCIFQVPKFGWWTSWALFDVMVVHDVLSGNLFQAASIKLKKEKEELETMVEEARKRLEAGEAPTDDVQREWDNMQRTQDIISKLAREKASIEGILERQGSIPVPNTPQRPNAYIPEDLGIPKPYGSNAPFKPSDAGSTMRHTRNPEPRDIVL